MPVFEFRSNMVGAPVLSGTQGSLINVLDACLVNGFGATTPTQITRDGTTVTVGFIEPHNYNSYDWIEFTGAEEPEYNGVHRVKRVDDYTITYEITGTPSSPATGEFAAKRAPAGFVKPFEGLNKAVYRSTHPKSNKHFLRINDDGTAADGARYALVCAYEQMTDIDSGERRFPRQTVFGDVNGAWWIKSNANDASSRMWHIVSDGITFYLCIGTQLAASNFADHSYTFVQGFGQLKTVGPDAYSTFLSVCSNTDQRYGSGGILHPAGDYHNPSQKSAAVAVARNFAGHGTVWGVPLIGHGFGSQSALGQYAYLTYPHRIDGRFYMCPVNAYENDGGVFIRGQLPGAYESPHGRTHRTGMYLESQVVVGMEGRRFVFIGGRGANSNSENFGGIWLDLDGPWT